MLSYLKGIRLFNQRLYILFPRSIRWSSMKPLLQTQTVVVSAAQVIDLTLAKIVFKTAYDCL